MSVQNLILDFYCKANGQTMIYVMSRKAIAVLVDKK